MAHVVVVGAGIAGRAPARGGRSAGRSGDSERSSPCAIDLKSAAPTSGSSQLPPAPRYVLLSCTQAMGSANRTDHQATGKFTPTADERRERGSRRSVPRPSQYDLFSWRLMPGGSHLLYVLTAAMQALRPPSRRKAGASRRTVLHREARSQPHWVSWKSLRIPTMRAGWLYLRHQYR